MKQARISEALGLWQGFAGRSEVVSHSGAQLPGSTYMGLPFPSISGSTEAVRTSARNL